MESKEELEKELEDLKTEQKEREKVEKMKKEIQALKAVRKDIGGSGIVDMLSRNHHRNAWILLGLFCGLLTQLVF